MTDTLPRHKPDPIPLVHATPEHRATGRLADVYGQTKRGLSVPWMGVVAMAFANYPAFYRMLWAGLEPLLQSEAFATACTDLRRCAEAEAATLRPDPIVGQLDEMGYAEAERDDIRACIEIFAAGNMPYVLMATIARALLEGIAWQAQGAPGPHRPQPPAAAKPPLMEYHHAGPATRAVYDDIMETLGLPFVNTDYRALARWPSYFALAWSDLKPVVLRPQYAASVDRVHHTATGLALSLPNCTGLTPSMLAKAADEDASHSEILAVVRLFQWLLPGLATNVALLELQVRSDGRA